MIFQLVIGFFQVAAAVVLDGRTLEPLAIQEVAVRVPKGSILVIGENHGFQNLADEQVELLRAIKEKHGSLDVGMEFLYYPDQELVTEYRAGVLPEVDFLKAVSWGKPDFSFYRRQILFPCFDCGEQTWALNAPRSLTSAISSRGLEKLTPEEAALLPPQFEVGRQSYFERFSEIMGGHVPADKLQRYFEAQSAWDDTMAWKAGQAAPGQTLVIIVGEFHVQYGGGLPDRLMARYPDRKIITFSQVLTDSESPEEVWQGVSPHPKYGPRADFVSVSPVEAP